MLLMDEKQVVSSFAEADRNPSCIMRRSASTSRSLFEVISAFSGADLRYFHPPPNWFADEYDLGYRSQVAPVLHPESPPPPVTYIDDGEDLDQAAPYCSLTPSLQRLACSTEWKAPQRTAERIGKASHPINVSLELAWKF